MIKKRYAQVAGTPVAGLHMGTLVRFDRGFELPYVRGASMTRDERRSRPPLRPTDWHVSAKEMLKRLDGDE
jgi:hypothetical protein